LWRTPRKGTCWDPSVHQAVAYFQSCKSHRTMCPSPSIKLGRSELMTLASPLCLHRRCACAISRVCHLESTNDDSLEARR
jgi:hypothetical protein